MHAFACINNIIISPCTYRYYSEYTLETILAAAFGRVVNLQKGEADEVTKAARGVFDGFGKRNVVRIAFFILCKFTVFGSNWYNINGCLRIQ